MVIPKMWSYLCCDKLEFFCIVDSIDSMEHNKLYWKKFENEKNAKYYVMNWTMKKENIEEF